MAHSKLNDAVRLKIYGNWLAIKDTLRERHPSPSQRWQRLNKTRYSKNKGKNGHFTFQPMILLPPEALRIYFIRQGDSVVLRKTSGDSDRRTKVRKGKESTCTLFRLATEEMERRIKRTMKGLKLQEDKRYGSTLTKEVWASTPRDGLKNGAATAWYFTDCTPPPFSPLLLCSAF